MYPIRILSNRILFVEWYRMEYSSTAQCGVLLSDILFHH